MASYNRIVLIGNLTRDPEYKQVGAGQAVCRLGLAINRQYKNKQSGSVTQEVCYIDIDVWGVQAESCRQYLQKGRSVLVEGRIKYDSWKDDQNGQTRSKHSVVADRIEFLNLGSNADASSSASTDGGSFKSGSRTSYDEPMKASAGSLPFEKELLGQIEQIKERAAKNNAKKAKPASESDEPMFRDEPPFDEELPF